MPDAIICSYSVKEQRLEEIAQSLGLNLSTEDMRSSRKIPPPPRREPPYTYLTNIDYRPFVVFDRQYGATADALTQVYREKTSIRLGLPVNFNGHGRTLARVTSPAFDGLPRRSQVAELILKNARWSGDALQINTGTRDRMNLDLRIPSLAESAWSLLRASTASAGLSDKGQLASRLEALALSDVLLQDGVPDVVRDLTTPRSKTLLNQMERMRDEGHPNTDLAELASAWGGRASRRYRSTAVLKGTSGRHAPTAAERLASEGWAERGFEIRCGQCTLRSFVPLNEAQAQPECPACGAIQRYEGSNGPALHYRLDSLVDRASDQGVVPHLLAVAVLRASAEHIDPAWCRRRVPRRMRSGNRPLRHLRWHCDRWRGEDVRERVLGGANRTRCLSLSRPWRRSPCTCQPRSSIGPDNRDCT